MNIKLLAAAAALGLAAGAAEATGLYECDAVDQSQWMTEEQMTKHLMDQGWQEVRRMKPDGGCWEVYGTTPDGNRVEGYFDPATGEQMLLAQRGRILFRKGE